MRARQLRSGLVAGMVALTMVACGTSTPQRPAASPREPGASSPTASPTPSPTPSPSLTAPRPSGRPIVGAVPPDWLGQRALARRADGYGEVAPTPPELEQRRFTLPDTVTALAGDGFASELTSPAPREVIARSTWRSDCPVAARQLSLIRLSFWGFDQRRHTGELLVNAAVAEQMISVFAELYRERFPIEEMRITRRHELDAPPTGDGNNTGSFVCRATVGATSYSQHAYGLAVDVNPFQNPYSKDDLVLPELASAYLDRSWTRPGMITPDGPVVQAFTGIDWTWGGTWSSLKDLHHFSANGR